MTYQFLQLEKQNAIGILRFNLPERLYAFEDMRLQGIPVALRELLEDENVRGVIVVKSIKSGRLIPCLLDSV
jgi:enoyl-CoA hydratase/carnithine racemase